MRFQTMRVSVLVALLPCLACDVDAHDDALRAETPADATFEDPASDDLELAAPDDSIPDDSLAAIAVDDCPRFRALGVCPAGPDGDDPEDPSSEPSSEPPTDPSSEPPSSSPPRELDPILVDPDPEPEPDPDPEPEPERTLDETCEIVPVDPIVLWPPSHKLEEFTLADCVAELSGCGEGAIDPDEDMEIVSVRSDEYENGNGDGNTCEDTLMITSSSSFVIRSERAGTGDGRVYTIQLRYTDALGVDSDATCQIVVPTGHNVPAVDSGCQLCLDAAADDLDACDGCAYTSEDC